MSPDEIRAIADPATRAKAATDAIVTTRGELLAIRREAIAEMRKTMSYRKVAAALSVSTTRVVQYEEE